MHAQYHEHSFHLFQYKVQTRQQLCASVIDARVIFAYSMLQQLDVREISVEIFCYSSEAHVSMDSRRQLRQANLEHLGNGKSRFALRSCLNP